MGCRASKAIYIVASYVRRPGAALRDSLLSSSVSRSEQACADNMGVYWYVCKELVRALVLGVLKLMEYLY